MDILPNFDIGAFMSNPDLPIYGQIFAYGIGFAGIGVGLKQIVSAIAQFLELLKKYWLRLCPESISLFL